MSFKKTMTVMALGATLAAAGIAFAAPDARHANIMAAREHAQAAIEKMKAAQQANEYDLGGHAAKAEKLLHEADEEMRLAADAADRRK